MTCDRATTPGQGDPPGSQPELGASDADFRPAYLDKITFQEGFADTVSAGKKILAGSDQVNGDFSTPPSVIKQAATSE